MPPGDDSSQVPVGGVTCRCAVGRCYCQLSKEKPREKSMEFLRTPKTTLESDHRSRLSPSSEVLRLPRYQVRIPQQDGFLSDLRCKQLRCSPKSGIESAILYVKEMHFFTMSIESLFLFLLLPSDGQTFCFDEAYK